MVAFLLLLLTTEPLPQRCDAAEINHVIDGEGQVYLQQVILWQIDERGRRCCWDWALEKECRISGKTVWFKGRKVQVGSVDRTITDHDPELENREYYPVEMRRVK